jgi:hypothetical protein
VVVRKRRTHPFPVLIVLLRVVRKVFAICQAYAISLCCKLGLRVDGRTGIDQPEVIRNFLEQDDVLEDELSAVSCQSIILEKVAGKEGARTFAHPCSQQLPLR